MNKSSLLLVDLQNDFMPSGRLPVPHGDEVVKVANHWLKKSEHVIASQDWHPKEHLSFALNHKNKKPNDVIDLYGIEQVLWPVHCVQETFGAMFHQDLKTQYIDYIQKKGTNYKLDSYSAFFENDRKTPTGLAKYIAEKKINSLFVLGLATDYCVKYTVLDALKLGLTVSVIKTGCRAINVHPSDEKNALADMVKAGATLI